MGGHGPGITSGISGIAEVHPGSGSGELLAVHDNKHAGGPRVPRVRTGADASTTVLGTDDENPGGWVRWGDVCG
ncbi:hypothetical protein ABZ714_19785 [Streptomyces sp. NPDC006798]|uniref:hypothetical protein n=1 Tax=Streptomyces sp. NPDC006798 TaxID=3155462 RepID=UPI00341117EC